MKKRLSVLSLGVRLTWMAAFVSIALTCGLQGWLFWRQLSAWGDVEYDAGYRIALEHMIETGGIATVGTWGVLVLLICLAGCVGAAQSGMTLRRLRVREWEVTIWWSLLFFGYFLLYWACQLGMLLWMFHMYAQVRGWTLMDLFISSFSSNYFHTVLPLYEPWAVGRNLFLCLGGGVTAALSSMEVHHGGKPFMLAVFYFLSKLFQPDGMASQVSDIAAIAVLGCLLAGYVWSLYGRFKNED